MAGTTTRSRDNAGHPEGALRQLTIEFNKLVADVELIRARYATGTAVTATTAAELLAARIGDLSGAAISS